MTNEMKLLICIVELINPVSLILLGILWRNSTNLKINKIIGYRTKLSMLNDETWKFAHKRCANYMLQLGIISLIIYMLIYIIVIIAFVDYEMQTFIFILVLQCITFAYPIIKTERDLKNFISNQNK